MPRDHIEPALRTIFANLLGSAAADVDRQRPFVEMGLDSLAFLQASEAIQQTLGVKVAFRQLVEELTTLERLAKYVGEHANVAAAPETPAPAAPPAAPPPPAPAAQAAPRQAIADLAANARPPVASESTIDRIIAQQLNILSQQLQLLRGLNGAAKPAPHPQPRPAGATPPAETPPSAGEVPARPFVAHEPIRPHAGEALDGVQHAHVQRLIDRVTRRTPNGLRMAEEARPRVATSRTTAGFRMLWKRIQATPIVSRADGAYVWDVDGNEYVDLTMGFGALLFGHTPAFVVDALQKQIARGLQLGGESPAAAGVGQLLHEMTGAERVAFCNSGTEAVMSALRLARAVTGRRRVVLFEGCYHGTFDGVMVRRGRRDAAADGKSAAAAPLAPGVPPSMIQDVLLLRMNDPASIAAIADAGSELAAVLVEPLPSRFPGLRPQEFLRQLRDVATRVGAALIFDELVTGFRVHPGGAQRLFGVQADLVTYGKALGAGMPVAAVAGKAEYLDAIDGGMWKYDDDSYPRAATTFFAGTYFGHPLILPVVEAVLSHMHADAGRLHAELNRRATHLADTLNARFERDDIPVRVSQFQSLFRFDIHPAVQHGDLFYFHMLERGVYICETHNCFLSTAHSDADVERVIEAAHASARELREAGFFPSRRALLGQGGDAAAVPDGPRIVPLTDAQHDLWIVAQLGDEASRAYNEATAVHFHGPLAADALCRAAREVMAQHDALRVTFLADGSGQVIHPRVDIDVPITDLRHLPPPERARACAARLEEDARHVFDLVNGPLVRARLIGLDVDHHILTITIPHIVIDGVSKGRVLQEMSAAYAAIVREKAYQPRPIMLFEEYVQRSGSEDARAIAARDESYWQQRLSGARLLLDLPHDHLPPARTYSGARVRRTLDQATLERLRRMSSEQRSTTFVTLLSIWTLLLHRVTGQSTIVVGVAIADQPAADPRALVGYCLNFIPFRVDVGAGQSFSAFLADVRRAWHEAYEHRRVSLNSLLGTLKPARDPSRSFPISAAFNVDRVATVPFHEGVTAEVEENYTGTSKFDVYLGATERDGQVILDLEYNRDLFDEPTADAWLQQCVGLVHAILDDPGAPLPAIAAARDDTRERIGVPAPELPESTVDAWIELQALRNPSAIAMVEGERRLTYEELNRRANALAAWLVHRGVRPETTVAVAAERSIAAVVGLLAIWKAGAAYVPLDPSLPEQRLAYILKDSGARLLLVTERTASLASSARVERLNIDGEPAVRTEHAAFRATPPVSMDQLAYVMYTSGSTGAPKGVMVTHRGLSNYVRWAMAAYPVAEGRGSLVATSFAFDLTITGLLLPLVAGREVWLVPEDDPLTALASTMSRYGDFSLIKLTPAHLDAITHTLPRERAARAARSFIIGGEALRSEPLRFWQENAPATELVNEYGPTETVVGCCVYRVPRDIGAGPVPIGTAIANTELYVLDARLQPCAVNAPGELFIAGAGLARGYANRPDLTAEVFLPNPFSARPGERMYRTGDVARRRDDGQLEYHGRTDQQVKILGHRIELGEIETVLCAHPAVAEAVAAAFTEPPAGVRAYVVPRDGAAVSSADLKEHLAAMLPSYMVPRSIEQLARMPLTANGKVDRHELARRRSAEPPPAATEPPRSDAEERLARVCAEVLKLPSVSVTASFFELGGDSIQAIRVSARAKRAGLPITPRQIFELRTVRALAAALAPPAAPAAAQPIVGTIPLTPIQRWFFEQEIEPRAHFNQAILVDLDESVDPAAMRGAVAAAIGHHDALRFRYRRVEYGYEQWCAEPDGPPPFEAIDLGGSTEADAAREIARHAGRLQVSLDLDRGPIVRVALFRQRSRDRLFIVVHHLAIDVVSWPILVEDLRRSYQQIARGEAPALPARTSSYQQWANYLRTLADARETADEIAYWEREIAGAGRISVETTAANLEGCAEIATLELDDASTHRLVYEMPKQYQASLDEAILTAIGRALVRWTGSRRVVVDVERHGREAAEAAGLDLTRTIGWFTAIHPIALDDLDDEGDIAGVRRVRARLRRVPAGGLGYGLLKYTTNDSSQRARLRSLPSAQVSFNYLGRVDGPADAASAERRDMLGPMRAPSSVRPYLIDVLAVVAAGRLQMSWTYSGPCFARQTIERVAGWCLDDLRAMADQCGAGDDVVDIGQLESMLGQLR